LALKILHLSEKSAKMKMYIKKEHKILLLLPQFNAIAVVVLFVLLLKIQVESIDFAFSFSILFVSHSKLSN